jgi:hypothetical protein
MDEITTVDAIEREVRVGDYVVSYNNLYRVREIYQNRYCKIMLVNPSKTTRPKKVYSREMYLLHREDVLIWKIKHGITDD